MDVEFFIMVVLIVLVLVSCCGLLQKIRKSYEDNNRGRVISLTQITIPNQAYPSVYQTDTFSNGVFPAPFTPPPYLEYMDPPPKYEDLVKQNQLSVATLENETTRNVPSSVTNNNNNHTQ